jgi:hypothetical protein
MSTLSDATLSCHLVQHATLNKGKGNTTLVHGFTMAGH